MLLSKLDMFIGRKRLIMLIVYGLLLSLALSIPIFIILNVSDNLSLLIIFSLFSTMVGVLLGYYGIKSIIRTDKKKQHVNMNQVGGIAIMPFAFWVVYQFLTSGDIVGNTPYNILIILILGSISSVVGSSFALRKFKG